MDERNQQSGKRTYPEISAAIITRNRSEALNDCLRSLFLQSLRPFEVLVIDSESEDDTPNIARSFPLKYIRIPHRGVAFARNRAIEAFKGRYIAFIDDDCVAAANWLEELYRGMVLQDADIAAGNTYFYADPSKLQYSSNNVSPAGVCISPQDDIWWDEKEKASANFTYTFFCTLNILIKKEVFDKVRFDEYYRFWMEDVDFSIRAKRLNIREALVPQATVLHRNIPLGEHRKNFNKIKFRNSAYFVKKNFGVGRQFAAHAFFLVLKLNIIDVPLFITQTWKGISDASRCQSH